MPCRAATRASDARSSGLAPSRRIRGGQATSSGRSAGRPASARDASAAEERGEVLAGVVPAGIDEVATGQPEPLALRGGVVIGRGGRSAATAPGRRGERRPRGQRDHPDPVRAEMEQAAGRGLHLRAGDEHRGRVAQQPAAQALPEPRGRGAAEGLRQLPRRQVEQRRDDGQPRRDRQRPRAGRVVERAGGPAAVGPPGGPERRPAQQERVHGHRRRAEEVRRRQLAAADDGQVRVGRRRVVEVAAQQERERFAVDGLLVEGAEQAVQIGGRDRRPRRLLERPRVEDDPHAGRRVRPRAGRSRARPGPGRRAAARPDRSSSAAPRRSRSRSSSARSWTTTTSASTMIRRDILLWPTRRSRNVIGTSRMRAPARSARKVISIWKT